MEGKKISFGFTKTKKENKPLAVEKKEYIDCVEEKSIKIVGGEIVQENKPLIIPMKPNTLITAERLKQIAEKVENFEEPQINDNIDDKKDLPINESIDEMALRELMEDAKKKDVEKPNLVVPINVLPVFEGKAEATLDDYESVPVQDFGMAMLRGMGWTPSKDQSKYKQPQLRPKGLGLGADKVIKENQKKSNEKEELSLVKNAFVKITTGKHSGFYGKVVSLDDDNGRVMVDITIKKETVNLSEFMMQAVSKSEYDKQSKVINTESYEEYKKKEAVSSKQYNPREETRSATSSRSSSDVRDRKYEDRHRKNDHSNGRSKDKHRLHQRKYSSNESLSTDSEKHKRRDSSSDSDRKKHKKEKKDIDKKRKGKKKKRDRDRSPNYKKYRK